MLLLGLTVLFFLPLILDMSNSLLVPGFGGTQLGQQSRDKYHFIWNFWWLRYAIPAHLDPLRTQLMFYPQGASLALQTIDYLDGAIAAPLALAFTKIFSYNVVILLSFPLAGVTAFLFSWHLTESRLASVIGGLIFAFFPQHTAQAIFGHPNISNVAWFPAYFLALMLTFESGKAKYALLAAVILSALTLIDLEQLVMAGIGTLIYLVYRVIETRAAHPLRFLTLACLTAAVAIGVTSPYLYSSQRVSSGPRNHRGSEKLRDSQTLSDPASVQRSLRPQLFLIVRGARRRTRKLDDLRWLDRPRARGDRGDNHEG